MIRNILSEGKTVFYTVKYGYLYIVNIEIDIYFKSLFLYTAMILITATLIHCLAEQIMAPPPSTALRLTRTKKIKQKKGYTFSKHGKSNCLSTSDSD